MIHYRPVSLSYSPFREYSTLEEAIFCDGTADLFVDDIADGIPIKDVRWSDAAAHFLLENDQRLSVTYDRRNCVCSFKHDWRVPGVDAPATIGLHMIGPYGESDCLWERGDELRQVLGKQLKRVLSNPPSMFVYTEGSIILMFSVFWDMEQNRPLLYWSPTT